jgi:hypothetical protein
MLGLFGRSKPAQCAFCPPDPAAAVAVNVDFGEPAILPAYRVQLSEADQVAADLYLKSKPLAKEHGGNEERAKKALLASLGSASSGVLPDGRIVSRHCVPVAAEAAPRKACVRTSISIN